MELGLDGGEIGKNIGVVVFEIVQHRGARPVVDKLAALVEKRRVVLVGLNHKKRRIALRRARRYAEIGGNAADQKAGPDAAVFEYPGQHCRGTGLAVGAGHCQHPLAVKQVFAQPLRAGGIRKAAVEDGLDHRHAARHHVADHVQVGLVLVELGGVHPLVQFDAGGFQLRGHRRVDIFIATGDGVTGVARQHGDAAHERSADAEDMNVHVFYPEFDVAATTFVAS